MPLFFALLAEDIKTTLAQNYSKIKMQADGFDLRKQVVTSFNFSLAEENNPFQIEDFIA